jgi:hypothetical protein
VQGVAFTIRVIEQALKKTANTAIRPGSLKRREGYILQTYGAGPKIYKDLTLIVLIFET